MKSRGLQGIFHPTCITHLVFIISVDPKLNQVSTKCTPFHQRGGSRKLSTILTKKWDLIAKILDLKAVYREIFVHNRWNPSTSKLNQLHIVIFLFFFDNMTYIPQIPLKLIGYFPAVLSLTQLFLELNQLSLNLNHFTCK